MGCTKLMEQMVGFVLWLSDPMANHPNLVFFPTGSNGRPWRVSSSLEYQRQRTSTCGSSDQEGAWRFFPICWMVAKQLIMSSENSLKACRWFFWIRSPLMSLFITDLAIWLGCPYCSFRVFRAVAYMTPFDPKPEIARSASPTTCILSWIILMSSFRCFLSWMWILKRSMKSGYDSADPSNCGSSTDGISLLASSLNNASATVRTPAASSGSCKTVSWNSTRSSIQASNDRGTGCSAEFATGGSCGVKDDCCCCCSGWPALAGPSAAWEAETWTSVAR